MENNSDKKLWMGFVASLLLSIGCLLVNHHWFRVCDILNLEFARSQGAMHTIILGIKKGYPSESYHILKMNTIVDYGFLAGYSLLVLFALKIFLNGLEMKHHYGWVYAVACLTGFWDGIENIFLLKSGIAQQAYFSSIYFWAVRIKWGFSIIAFLLVPFVAIYGIILSTRAKQEN